MFVFKLSQLLWIFAILSFSNVAVAQGGSADKLDLVGIRLGMTESEVAAAVKAFDPAAKQTSRRMAHYPYSDGVTGFQTQAFLDEVVYQAGDSRIRVWFASPPAESRVYAIHRYSTGNRTPPTRQQFSSALTSKYGAGQSHYLANTGSNVMQWNEAGKPECAVSTNARVVVDASPDTLMPPRAVEILEGLGKMQHPNLKRSMGNSVDVGRCGVVLRYVWGGPANDSAFPITEFYAWLVDQGGMVTKNRQTLKWVAQQEAEAVRKRQKQGATPKL